MRAERDTNFGRCVVYYDSLQEFCNLPPMSHRKQIGHNQPLMDEIKARLTNGCKGAYWYGIDAEKLTDAIKDGWQEGADTILKQMEGIDQIDAPISIKRRRVRGDFGDSIDMQAVYRGNLDTAWTRCTKRPVKAPRPVTLVASMQGTGDTEQSVFYARGAALLKVADLLTTAGYAVEIVADYTVKTCFERLPDTLTHRIPLKAAHEPLDVSRLAACVALAGFKRHYGFMASIRAANDEFDLRLKEDMGASIYARKIDASEIIGFERATDIQTARDVVQSVIEVIQGRDTDPA